jgi:putative nucleotidyltransferase with HDIG domain
MPLNRLKQTLLSVCAILQGLRLYPARHPQIQRQLETAVNTLQTLFSEKGKLTVGMLDGTLLLNDIPCLDQLPALEELSRLLERQQLQSVDFLPGVDSRQLLFFCQELPQLHGGGFPERLERAAVNAIRVTLSDEEQEDPRVTYHKAVQTVEEIFHDVRLGQIPSSGKAVNTVKNLLKSILEDPTSLFAMTLLKDYDNYTFTHSVNVSVLAITVGTACGMGQQELYYLGMGGLLHDLGKMTIDHRIITKPGKLSREEIEEMKLHPVNGARIVAEMEQINAVVVDIVNSHHLHFDRSGYPADSRGQAISPLADMVGIADTYDALTTLRCYQRPRSPKQALSRMMELNGSMLHPEFLQKFIAYLGPYPVGTLVRLKDGSIGLVCDQEREQPGALTLKILFRADGSSFAEPPLKRLSDSSLIIAEVDPLLKGIRLEDYLPD